MRAFDWCQNQRPWMTLNGHYALCFKNTCVFGAHRENLNEDRPILSLLAVWVSDPSFWQHKVYADIPHCRLTPLSREPPSNIGYSRGVLWRGASNDNGVIENGNF